MSICQYFKWMLQGIVFFVATLFLNMSLASEIVIPTQKQFPPYPEVWGYDLSQYPVHQKGLPVGIDVYRMDDGDIWFIVASDYTPNNNEKAKNLDRKYLLIKFFKQEIVSLDYESKKKLVTIIDKYDIGFPTFEENKTVYFSDGSTLRRDYTSPAKLCGMPDFVLEKLIKTFPNGKEEEYSILAAYPQIRVREMQIYCEGGGGFTPFLYQILYFFPYNLIDLGDDTFIAFPGHVGANNLILRFDRNLHTKFQAKTPVGVQNNNHYLSKNFFVIPYSHIQHPPGIELDTSPYQSMHDALLLYFREEQEKNTKN